MKTTSGIPSPVFPSDFMDELRYRLVQNLIATLPTYMNTTNRKNLPRNVARRGSEVCRRPGQWAFNFSSDRLFALGSTDRIRRAAYRSSSGEMRFFPL